MTHEGAVEEAGHTAIAGRPKVPPGRPITVAAARPDCSESVGRVLARLEHAQRLARMRQEHVHWLADQLRLARQRLQATVAELGAANEELKSSRGNAALAGTDAPDGSVSEAHEERTAEQRQRLLVVELQHRVSNILAAVRSIFTRSIEMQGATEASADHFRGRLDALARTQNVLARTLDGGIDLEEMVRNELTCHGLSHSERAHIAGPAIRLRPRAAEALGMVVHELATNAAKYGALADGAGRICVTWRTHLDATGHSLRWEWAENGVRLIDSSPSHTGFGRELIERGLPAQLAAKTMLEFASGGVRCAIELPLNQGVARLDHPETT